MIQLPDVKEKVSFNTGALSKLVSASETRQFLQKGLAAVEQLIFSQVEGYHPDLKAASELILSSNGKRIRPRIILLVGKLLGGNFESLITLATSIEMLHNATLVHDDLIDGALLRRGIPTLNSKWSPAATVLTGDFVFACAANMAARTNSVEVMNLFSRTLMTIVNGEVNQLFTNRSSINVENYYLRIYAKTASLFETSTLSAAIISEVDHRQQELLRKFGYELGMAFQIVDDILDYSEDETTLGKPVGGDLRQGIITLPMLFYIENHPDDPAIRVLLEGNTIQDESEIKRLIEAINTGNSIVRAQNVVNHFMKCAETCIMEFPDSTARTILIEITRYIAERRK